MLTRFSERICNIFSILVCGYLQSLRCKVLLLYDSFFFLSIAPPSCRDTGPHGAEREIFFVEIVRANFKYRRIPSYLLCTLLLFLFNLLPSPVHPTGFFFCFFPGFLVIYTLLSSKNNSTRVTSTSRRSPSYFPFFFVFHLLLAPVNLTGISSHIFLAIFSCCYRKTAIIISIQLVKMYFN